MLKQQTTAIFFLILSLSIYHCYANDDQNLDIAPIGLTQEELNAIIDYPEIPIVYINDEVRTIIYRLAQKNPLKPLTNLVKNLGNTYKTAPRDQVIPAVACALSLCSDEQIRDILEAYKRELESGAAIITKDDVQHSQEPKNRFSSLFVKNCFSAGNAIIAGNQSVGGYILFGPRGLHVTGALEPNLLNIRGTIIFNQDGSLSQVPDDSAKGPGFTIKNASSLGSLVTTSPNILGFMYTFNLYLEFAKGPKQNRFKSDTIPAITFGLNSNNPIMGAIGTFNDTNSGLVDVKIFASNVTNTGFNLNFQFVFLPTDPAYSLTILGTNQLIKDIAATLPGFAVNFIASGSF